MDGCDDLHLPLDGKTRLSSRAQLMRCDCARTVSNVVLGGRSGLGGRLFLREWPLRHHLWERLGVRGQNAVKSDEEQLRPWHQRRLPLHEFQQAHDRMRDPVAPRRLELELRLPRYRSAHGRGLKFPKPDETLKPDYADFLYFLFTIAVASQTADASITDRPMRRLVLLQSVLSFVFDTTILAFMIKIAAGLF